MTPGIDRCERRNLRELVVDYNYDYMGQTRAGLTFEIWYEVKNCYNNILKKELTKKQTNKTMQNYTYS